jgi:hypothetical protein
MKPYLCVEKKVLDARRAAAGRFPSSGAACTMTTAAVKSGVNH